MKNLFITLSILSLFIITSTGKAQQINWRNLKDNKTHFANINMGWGYGTVAGIGYGQKLATKFPVVLNIEFSAPFGEDLFDDFKTKLGGQAELFNINNFSATVKVYGLFRQYKNEYVKMSSFGSEFAANVGYYKPKWFAAGEFGFDKAIATHIKNSDEMKENYPDSEDGWYVPTGGNFFYGITGGYSLKSIDVYLKAGKTVTQDFKTTPTIPFYAEVGFNFRF
jgi:hypothetical protein